MLEQMQLKMQNRHCSIPHTQPNKPLDNYIIQEQPVLLQLPLRGLQWQLADLPEATADPRASTWQRRENSNGRAAQDVEELPESFRFGGSRVIQ